MGPFLFTELLRPLLEATGKTHGAVRLCAVSSGAHKRAAIYYEDPFNVPSDGAFSGAYGQSKLAQVMHMRALQERLRAKPGLGGEDCR